MTAHDHRVVVEGCYRCELGADEVARVTGGTHQARVARRYRGGQWTVCASCPCGWESYAWSERSATQLVAQHNRTPNEPAEQAS